jgi:hypothetical protein
MISVLRGLQVVLNSDSGANTPRDATQLKKPRFQTQKTSSSTVLSRHKNTVHSTRIPKDRPEMA